MAVWPAALQLSSPPSGGPSLSGPSALHSLATYHRVHELLAAGRSTRDVARQLSLSAGTVESMRGGEWLARFEQHAAARGPEAQPDTAVRRCSSCGGRCLLPVGSSSPCLACRTPRPAQLLPVPAAPAGYFEADASGSPKDPPAPTPQEIRAACAQIQSTWSEDERQSRRCGVCV
jgi:hypothetical protein